jgi:hypothetical protein
MLSMIRLLQMVFFNSGVEKRWDRLAGHVFAGHVLARFGWWTDYPSFAHYFFVALLRSFTVKLLILCYPTESRSTSRTLPVAVFIRVIMVDLSSSLMTSLPPTVLITGCVTVVLVSTLFVVQRERNRRYVRLMLLAGY